MSHHTPAPSGAPGPRQQVMWAHRYIARRYGLAPSRWTKIYWPVGLMLCIGAFTFATHHRGAVLIGACAVLAIPELAMLISGNDRNTLSDWVWDTLRITKSTPISSWTAAHFLALASYVALAAAVDAYLWHKGWLAFSTGAVLSVWLTRHLFWRWWA